MPSNSKSQSTSRHRIPSALRSGVYSTLAVLPGEDRSAYDRLHRDLVAELMPDGALEKDQVATIARLTWPKNNPRTLRIAMLGQHRLSTVLEELIATKHPEQAEIVTHGDSGKMVGAAEDKVRQEFGDAYNCVELGPVASVDALAQDLDLEERIDGMIEKCVKRLLLLRGFKSMPAVMASQPARRIVGPPEAG